MTDFRERLQQATERGKRAREAQLSAAAAKALSDEECRRLHSNYRLTLCDHIESCLGELADRFPGFRLETIVDKIGWGTVASRDDVGLAGRRSDNFFSRLQITVSPYGTYHVLEVVAKGTIRNKEAFSRTHYQRLDEFDLDRFKELIEGWVVDYAEMFAAANG
jgi:hypothetical protein